MGVKTLQESVMRGQEKAQREHHADENKNSLSFTAEGVIFSEDKETPPSDFVMLGEISNRPRWFQKIFCRSRPFEKNFHLFS